LVIHVLKEREKKYGYISLKGSESELSGRRFTVRIGAKRLFDRSMDSQSRVYLGRTEMGGFRTGQVLNLTINNELSIEP